jgi:putative ribosome biogenesis GTPase RsgA
MWQSVNQRSLSNCNAVHSVSGQDTLVVFADSDMDELKNAKPRHVTAVVGDSGTGKSSLVKFNISSRIEDINLIWLSQDELDKPNQHVLAS